jgi:hypothetical protein
VFYKDIVAFTNAYSKASFVYILIILRLYSILFEQRGQPRELALNILKIVRSYSYSLLRYLPSLYERRISFEEA